MEEKRRVICLTVGINETKVLKYLKEKEDYFEYDKLFEKVSEDTTLKYESNFNAVLGRLLRKKLIEKKDDDSIRISKKGFLFLEIIKIEKEV